MFCNQLRLYRRIMELSQVELGRVVGVSASTIGMYEQGRRRPGPRVYSRLRELFRRRGLELSPPPSTPELRRDTLGDMLSDLLPAAEKN